MKTGWATFPLSWMQLPDFILEKSSREGTIWQVASHLCMWGHCLQEQEAFLWIIRAFLQLPLSPCLKPHLFCLKVHFQGCFSILPYWKNRSSRRNKLAVCLLTESLVVGSPCSPSSCGPLSQHLESPLEQRAIKWLHSGHSLSSSPSIILTLFHLQSAQSIPL